jgi:2'-5' RNA ligase
MTGWAIVAIPEAQDPVWRYSSEKIPHMTLLFLGENGGGSDLEHVVEFVKHVAESSMFPFYMHVDSRGPLGPDDADVLFFDKARNERSVPGLARSYFLQDDEIKKAYNSIEQYPEWTPHLTMGYPKSPAKEDDRDYPGFGSVHFDRVALWNGEYEGPEFKLVYPERGDGMEVAWSDKAAAYLEHVGVKGMKWGIHKKEKAEPIPDGEYRVTAKPGQKVKVEGGRGLSPHEDAIRVAAAREAAKNSSTDSLSTKQLQELVTRTQLEQQYSKLTTPQNQSQMKNGLKKLNEIMAIKKQVDQITQDPFIKEQMSNIAQDFGLDKLIRKGTEKLVNNHYK